MKKIFSITFISLLIFTSVSYSEIKAKYKLKCKVFDFGTWENKKKDDYFIFFDLDFVKSVFLTDMVIGKKTPNMEVILTLEKDKSNISGKNLSPHLWFTEKDDRGESHLITFTKENIRLSSSTLVLSKTNEVIDVKTAKSLCNEVNSFKN